MLRATISGLGALVVLVLTIRNLIKRPAAIAAAKFPAYMRSSYNMSLAVSLSCILPWTAATFLPKDFEVWLSLMLSPIVLALILVVVMARNTQHQTPEIRNYVQEIAKSSRIGRLMAEIQPDKPEDTSTPPVD